MRMEWLDGHHLVLSRPQHLRRMFVLAEVINNWHEGRVADNWLRAENKNIIDPHTPMVTQEATDGLMMDTPQSQG